MHSRLRLTARRIRHQSAFGSSTRRSSGPTTSNECQSSASSLACSPRASACLLSVALRGLDLSAQTWCAHRACRAIELIRRAQPRATCAMPKHDWVQSVSRQPTPGNRSSKPASICPSLLTFPSSLSRPGVASSRAPEPTITRSSRLDARTAPSLASTRIRSTRLRVQTAGILPSD